MMWMMKWMENIAKSETKFTPPSAMNPELKRLVCLEGLRLFAEKWLMRSILLGLIALVMVPSGAEQFVAALNVMLIACTLYVSNKHLRYHDGIVCSHGVYHPC